METIDIPLWLILVLTAGVYWPATVAVALIGLVLAAWTRLPGWLRVVSGLIALVLLGALALWLIMVSM